MIRPRLHFSLRTPARPIAVPFLAALLLPIAPWVAAVALVPEPSPRPDLLLVTVDALRADRLSAYGHFRPTSPHIDLLLEHGVRFLEARAVEPLTAPSMVSAFTSLHPHEHGATRNGLRMRAGLNSWPRILRDLGYHTGALVGNWTLRDKLCGLGEHFEDYREVLSRKRWFGLFRGEATARDLTDRALQWLREHADRSPGQPFFLWVHYVEPHAPYRFHPDQAPALGLRATGPEPAAADRYDTEIAFVDQSIGRLLEGTSEISDPAHTLLIFGGDHGESLGEHGDWGHGRNLFDVALRIPLGFSWAGRIRPGVVKSPAVLLDLAPTVLGLLGRPRVAGFRGYDWSGVLLGGREPEARATAYQAHKGAILSHHGSARARAVGLLEVGVIDKERKESFRIADGRRLVFDLASDPAEIRNRSADDARLSPPLQKWLKAVFAGLQSTAAEPGTPLDPESEEKLRSLGYVD